MDIMTESEFAATLRGMHRESEAERSARLAPVAHELEVERHVDFYPDEFSGRVRKTWE